jgi:hypothetical protein
MKNIILLSLLFLVSKIALGQGDAPPMYQGDCGTTKRVCATAILPNNQITKISSSKVRLETGNGNILANPSFEAQNAGDGWSVTLNDGSPIDDGLKAGCRTYSGSPVSITQDSTLYATAFSSGTYQGVARASLLRSGSGTLYLCPRKAGATVDISLCKTFDTGSQAQRKEIPFTLDGTSNGLAITSNGVNYSGIVCVDNTEVKAENLKQTITPISAWTTFTPTGTWTTNTTYTGKYRQIGQNL